MKDVRLGSKYISVFLFIYGQTEIKFTSAEYLDNFITNEATFLKGRWILTLEHCVLKKTKQKSSLYKFFFMRADFPKHKIFNTTSINHLSATLSLISTLIS